MGFKSYNIKLTNTNAGLSINNKNDVENLDHVLGLLVDNWENQINLKEILNNTSLKYLKRLQEDGLLKDDNGPDIVPIFKPIVTEKAIRFKATGGYSYLYNSENNLVGMKKFKKHLSKWWWLFVIPILAGIILLVINNMMFEK